MMLNTSALTMLLLWEEAQAIAPSCVIHLIWALESQLVITLLLFLEAVSSL